MGRSQDCLGEVLLHRHVLASSLTPHVASLEANASGRSPDETPLLQDGQLQASSQPAFRQPLSGSTSNLPISTSNLTKKPPNRMHTLLGRTGTLPARGRHLRVPVLISALSVMSLATSGLGLSAREAKAQPETAEIGKPVPAFEIEALRDSGRTVTPSDFEGRYVLMNLWATWCPPCIQKIPDLKEARRRYSRRGLAILNVSLDRSRSTATAFLEKREMPGTHAHVSEGLMGEFGGKFARMPSEQASMEVRGIPNLTLVGPTGRVAGIISAEDSTGLLKMLSEHLSSHQSR